MHFRFNYMTLNHISPIYLVTSIAFYLFIYISSSDCIASNGMIIVNNELEMMEKEGVVACLR
jgi:hypothetical protein